MGSDCQWRRDDYQWRHYDASESTRMERVFFNMAFPEVEIELRHDGTVVAVDCTDFYCALAYGPSPEGMMSAAMKYFA